MQMNIVFSFTHIHIHMYVCTYKHMHTFVLARKIYRCYESVRGSANLSSFRSSQKPTQHARTAGLSLRCLALQMQLALEHIHKHTHRDICLC